ncbi:MAG: lytic transglycosylase domain-containing protein, partial [Deltaproteobacteria bacterium]|nr:lytic transglycosylase domain-containing protein [Deltaproteobacteria bacterium]
SRLTPENDERLNEAVCSGVIDRVLDECLDGDAYGLRDKLARFYNKCHGINKRYYPLTVNNTRFVNHVFNGFLEESTQGEKEKYVLDLDMDYNNHGSSYDWKEAAGSVLSKEYVFLLGEAFEKLGDSNCPVDPLLFIALMKKESSFEPISVSGVGAAGLTQIMPETAVELGMNNIFMPDYYLEAVSLLKKEREIRSKALSTLFEINEGNGLELAGKARDLMQESLETGAKRTELYKRYKEDLVKNRVDDRLQAALSIEYGLRYFTRLMKKFNGDISLALASYNAGETRVRDYKGIPPFEETVGFRNKILQYYREYLEKGVTR